MTTDHILCGDDLKWRLIDERDRYLSAAKQAKRNAADRYSTIAETKENLERAARLELRAADLTKKLKGLEQ